MFKLKNLVSDSISLIPDFKIHKQFRLNRCETWYVVGNTAETGEDYKKTLECIEESSQQEVFEEYLDRSKDKNKLVKIAGNIFSSVGAGRQDDDDIVDISFPYNQIIKGSFGGINGSIDLTGRINESESSKSFAIYMAPNKNYFEDIDKKLTNPKNQTYTFFLSDLIKYGADIKRIPGISNPKKIKLMYWRAWF